MAEFTEFAEDPVSHEQNCLFTLIESLAATSELRNVVHGVWLSGRFPETTLHVLMSKLLEPDVRTDISLGIWNLRTGDGGETVVTSEPPGLTISLFLVDMDEYSFT